MNDDVFEARIAQYDAPSGYGFVRDPNGSDQDVFVHVNEFDDSDRRDLRDGSLISFEVVEGERGLRAVNCELVRQEGELSTSDYRSQVTDAIIAADATLTTGQLDNVRRAVVELASKLGHLA